MDVSEYQENIKALSNDIVRAQSPIRILDAIKWAPQIKEKFFAKKCKAQPDVTLAYYQENIPFDWSKQRENFHIIKREITKKLGQFNTVGLMMRRICSEYTRVLHMLEARGTPEFSLISQELYGSAQDVFHVGDPTLAQLGILMAQALEEIDKSNLLDEEKRTIPAAAPLK